ncbi:MAG TPA: tetratricopeptide repeat protein [bacterium]|nr:tetratricopeptide repeat protein [bacterium]
MPKDARVFVDKDREVMSAYYDFCDYYDSEDFDYGTGEKLLREFIDEDPDFLDSYLTLREILLERGKYAKAERLLNEAYVRALQLIRDAAGNWPDELPWDRWGNRHIIRALLAKAEDLWEAGENEKALDILRRLLRTNLNDNIGARYYILAIRLGMDFDTFYERFEDEYGYYDGSILEWFNGNYSLFPEDFWGVWVEEDFTEME